MMHIKTAYKRRMCKTKIIVSPTGFAVYVDLYCYFVCLCIPCKCVRSNNDTKHHSALEWKIFAHFLRWTFFLHLFIFSVLVFFAHIHWMVAEEEGKNARAFIAFPKVKVDEDELNWWLQHHTYRFQLQPNKFTCDAMHKIRTAAAAASHIYVQINSFERYIYSRTWLDLIWTIQQLACLYTSLSLSVFLSLALCSSFLLRTQFVCYLSNSIRIFTSCIEMNEDERKKALQHRFNLKALRYCTFRFVQCTSRIMTATYAVFRKMGAILYLLLLLKKQHHLHS